MDNLELNLNRAIQLLRTPQNYEEYVSIKIKPVDGGCCCYNHWHETWTQFNEFISQYQPVKKEGATLIERDGEKYVLESHESGPEIIAYLYFGTAVVGLITALLKFRQLESRNRSLKFKLTKRYLIKGEVEEDNSIEVDLSLSDEAITKKIEDYTKKPKIKKRKKKM
ncbi:MULTISPECIES: hypothetical protein [unclassified Methanoregula]|uniref:hypothetical protein n=1 Tax=unclassified Methanoregula TaxID=2649730 RepID=UPI0009CDE27B|nr:MULTISPECIES: hypothetical protein [unclassified Methanoregula]OPX63139.1 MAG: hypothetical protein A4E33_01822 [Methanoregula sp. PtaB.Bin085]OPY33438.1 MAG: hypothetical protein A4E34_01761 [Methanoregula sp. PtaU1.Bin006]